MNIREASANTTHLMNITDMLAIADSANDPVDPYWGESRRHLAALVAYYGGINVGGSSDFDGLRK